MYIAGSLRSVDTGDTYFTEILKENISGNRGAKEMLNRDRIRSLELSTKKALEARIEHARFLVDCPNCNSAEFAFEDKLFFCSLCKNSDIQNKVRKVKMPTERKKIEEILSVRPIKNRHWTNETLQALAKENELHLEVM